MRITSGAGRGTADEGTASGGRTEDSVADHPTDPGAPVPPDGRGDGIGRVIVIGGGIGGLALAAGLVRHGIDVVVHERDTDLTATGGYHISLDGPAQTALAALLTPDALTQLLACASAVCRRAPDVFTDRRGRVVGHGGDLRADATVDIDRITLRGLLAAAVGPALRTGREFVGGEQVGDRVVARFADGSMEQGDLLVGADGAHSAVATQRACGPTNAPAGIVGLSGRTAAHQLDPAERARLGPRSGTVIGTGGTALYVGYLDPAGFAVRDPQLRGTARPVTTGPTYIWGAMFPDAQTDAFRGAGDGGAQRDLVLARLRAGGWTERPLQVVAQCDPATVGVFRFRAAPTDPARLAPWPAGRITALGDAVHATPATAGMGAGAAIRDAAALLEQLLAVRDGRVGPIAAVHAFEEGMRRRGAAVVRAALPTVRGVLATATPLGAAVTPAVLAVLATITRLRTGRRARSPRDGLTT